MEQFTAKLFAQMNSELLEIAANAENKLQQAERSFRSVEKTIAKLKEFISGYTFRDVEEEIRFFKEVKPEFQKELIYNEEILFIESNCPVGSNKARKLFIERTLSGIQAYFEKHSFIYNYCRSGDNTYDATYFVRNPKPIPLMPDSYSDIDPVFSNPHSYKVAKLKALEELRDYLRNRNISEAEDKGEQVASTNVPKRKRIFTGPKAAIEEIIHGVVAKGWVNYGDYPAQQLFQDFAMFLNVKLSDPARSLIGMAIRKKGYTPHIDGMKDALVSKIEEKHQ